MSISDRVIFVGQVLHTNLPFYISLGDAFVFTTIRDEGLPLNVLEAMSMNIPCVISWKLTQAINTIKYIAGIYTVNPADAEDIAKGMIKAIDFEKSVATGSSLNKNFLRSFVENYYSHNTMLDKYEKLLEKQLIF